MRNISYLDSVLIIHTGRILKYLEHIVAVNVKNLKIVLLLFEFELSNLANSAVFLVSLNP